MYTIKTFIISAATCAISVIALPSNSSSKRGLLMSGTISHALFDSSSACGPREFPSDMENGLYVGIYQGELYCNRYIKLTRDDGYIFHAKVVEATDGNVNDVIASKGVFDQMGVPPAVGIIKNVEWSLCSRNGVC